MAVSFIGGGYHSTWRKPPTCRKLLTNFITYCCIEYISLWTRFDLTTLVVICSDYTGSCRSNYHTLMTNHDHDSRFLYNFACVPLYNQWSFKCFNNHQLQNSRMSSGLAQKETPCTFDMSIWLSLLSIITLYFKSQIKLYNSIF